MTPHPSVPESLWISVPPEAQAAILAVIASLEKRIVDLEVRLNRNSTNSSKPPSTGPPAVKVKRRPPAPPSGRKRGGQPGHERHTRALVAPGQIRETFEVKPTHCGGCGAKLRGHDPDPTRHQVAEVPPIRPDVDEYRLHRLTCACCGTATRAGPPAVVTTGPFGPRLRATLAMFAGSYPPHDLTILLADQDERRRLGVAVRPDVPSPWPLQDGGAAPPPLPAVALGSGNRRRLLRRDPGCRESQEPAYLELTRRYAKPPASVSARRLPPQPPFRQQSHDLSRPEFERFG